VATTILSNREFSEDVGRAERAADQGPVVITDGGKPAYVLLRHDAYRQLTAKESTILDMLAQRGVEDIEFDPPKLGSGLYRAADLD
jgi:hypothetical protein